MECLKHFVDEIKKGRRDFFTLLYSPEEDFHDATFDELFVYKNDMLHGLNRVQKNFDDVYFGQFTRCLVKHFDDGAIAFQFVAQTTNPKIVIEFSQGVYELFKEDIDKYGSYVFSDHEKIRETAMCTESDIKKNLVESWHSDNLSLLLYYHTAPYHVFVLEIKIIPEKIIDKSERIKGTILDLLDFDINYLLAIQEPYEEEESEPEGAYVDYIYLIDKKQLGLFDKIRIRIYDQERKFREEVYTNVYLTCAEPVDFVLVERVMDRLVDLYGSDDKGNTELDYEERQVLELLSIWFGRTWSFNERHGLYDSAGKEEDFIYEVSISNFNYEGEFAVSISGFNSLVAMYE